MLKGVRDPKGGGEGQVTLKNLEAEAREACENIRDIIRLLGVELSLFPNTWG